jgi:hypothetical protein
MNYFEDQIFDAKSRLEEELPTLLENHDQNNRKSTNFCCLGHWNDRFH